MWDGGMDFLINQFYAIKTENGKKSRELLTHDNQELGVEGCEGRLQRVAGVEIIESRHTISPKSPQFVLLAGPARVWL